MAHQDGQENSIKQELMRKQYRLHIILTKVNRLQKKRTNGFKRKEKRKKQIRTYILLEPVS